MLIPITKEIFKKYLLYPKYKSHLDKPLQHLMNDYCFYCPYCSGEMCESDDIKLENGGNLDVAVRNCDVPNKQLRTFLAGDKP